MGEFREPQWQKPWPLGRGNALDSVTNVAAPLLAGFSVATIGVIVQSTDELRWPGVALVLLTSAAGLLVASLQFGFHAKASLHSPADVHTWYTEEDLAEEGRVHRLREEQARDFVKWERWARWATRSYNLGILALAGGVAAVLPPPTHSGGAQASLQWTAAALAAAGAMAELVWIGADLRPVQRIVQRLRRSEQRSES